jgi:hypothetical protein
MDSAPSNSGSREMCVLAAQAKASQTGYGCFRLST